MAKLLTPVVVAVAEMYNDNNGAYQDVWLWDGEQVTISGGMYCNKVYSVNCTTDQFEAAKAWQRENTAETIPYNKYCYNRLGAQTFLGCIVQLKGSRKAPNKTDLTVIEFHESYYDNRYNQHVTEKVTVTDGQESWTVSSNCIDKLVKGVKEYVFWADTETSVYAGMDDLHNTANQLNLVYDTLAKVGLVSVFNDNFEALYNNNK